MVRARKIRRIIDVAVAFVGVALCASPLLSGASAASSSSASLLDIPMTVDQHVAQTGMVSRPLTGDFTVSPKGKSVGELDWYVYTTAGEGFKLSVNAQAKPAMQTGDAAATVADYRQNPGAWSVGSGQRVFGFSAAGSAALSAYGQGDQWRGFDGQTPVEVARDRTGPATQTLTKVMLASQMNTPLPAGVQPTAYVVATASLNL